MVNRKMNKHIMNISDKKMDQINKLGTIIGMTKKSQKEFHLIICGKLKARVKTRGTKKNQLVSSKQ